MGRIPAIDISIWDEGIDLVAWKTLHGIGAVIVKCGGNEGRRYADPCFSDNMRKTQAAGIPAGVYYYTTSTTVDDAIADADHCASIIRNYDLQLPVFVDIEDSGQLGMSKRALTDVVKAFCDRIKGHGLRAGIYTFGSMWLNNMHADELRGYTTWIASWQDAWPTAYGRIDAWQQGAKRLSDGHMFYDDVSGYVDFDWFEDYVIHQDGGAGMGKIDPANVAALIHYDMVTDPRNGYSQAPERWGGDHSDGTKVLDIDGRRYTYKLGSYDCSSSVITAWKQALRYTVYEGALDRATYTGDMCYVFEHSTLFEAKYSPARRGDLYLNEGAHVAMCQDGGSDGVMGYDCLSEFNRNEFRGATNGQVGDQDGEESVVRDYYDDGWNTVLHYVGGLLDDVSGKHEKDDGTIGGLEMECLLQAPKGDKVYYFNGERAKHIGPDQLKGLQAIWKGQGKTLKVVELPQTQIDALTRL